MDSGAPPAREVPPDPGCESAREKFAKASRRSFLAATGGTLAALVARSLAAEQANPAEAEWPSRRIFTYVPDGARFRLDLANIMASSNPELARVQFLDRQGTVLTDKYLDLKQNEHVTLTKADFPELPAGYDLTVRVESFNGTLARLTIKKPHLWPSAAPSLRAAVSDATLYAAATALPGFDAARPERSLKLMASTAGIGIPQTRNAGWSSHGDSYFTSGVVVPQLPGWPTEYAVHMPEKAVVRFVTRQHMPDGGGYLWIQDRWMEKGETRLDRPEEIFQASWLDNRVVGSVGPSPATPDAPGIVGTTVFTHPVLGACAISLKSEQDSQRQYIPHLYTRRGWVSGVALVNPNDEDAVVYLVPRDSAGNELKMTGADGKESQIRLVLKGQENLAAITDDLFKELPGRDRIASLEIRAAMEPLTPAAQPGAKAKRLLPPSFIASAAPHLHLQLPVERHLLNRGIAGHASVGEAHTSGRRDRYLPFGFWSAALAGGSPQHSAHILALRWKGTFLR